MEFKICRVCLDRSASISVFNKQGDITYCAKIMRCVNVVIEEGDGFPDAICEGCAGDLAVCYDFAQRCEASDRALRAFGLLQTAVSEPDKQEHHIKPEILSLHKQTDDNSADTVYDECDDETCLVDIKTDEIKTEKDDTESHTPKHEEIHIEKSRIRKDCIVRGWEELGRFALEQREKRQSKEKPYTCDHCNRSYSSKSYLKIHILKHSSPKKCKKTDIKKAQTKRDPLQCTICGVMRVNQTSLKSHMRTHTGEKPFPCEVCGTRFRYKEILNRHVNSRHQPDPQRVFQCDHCGKVFYARSNIMVHLRIHSGDQPYHCQYCPSKFNQIGSLIRHVRSHTGSRPYVCAICGKAFNDKALLNRHQHVHTSEKKYKCNICNKFYKTKGALKIHTDHHNNVKLFVCSICGLTFTFKGNMKVHMRRKHSEKSGMCSVCNKEFGDIEAHMCTHTGRKPFTCKICDQHYMSQRSLTHHIHHKHKEPDKYKCMARDCKRAFPMPHMLKYHITKCHSTNTTPYVCPHCGRGFLRGSDLTRHLKSNHLDNDAKIIKHETIHI